MYARISNDYIAILQKKDGIETEVIGWHVDEWLEDPAFVVPAIANAIQLAYTCPEHLQKILTDLRK